VVSQTLTFKTVSERARPILTVASATAHRRLTAVCGPVWAKKPTAPACGDNAGMDPRILRFQTCFETSANCTLSAHFRAVVTSITPPMTDASSTPWWALARRGYAGANLPTIESSTLPLPSVLCLQRLATAREGLTQVFPLQRMNNQGCRCRKCELPVSGMYWRGVPPGRAPRGGSRRHPPSVGRLRRGPPVCYSGKTDSKSRHAPSERSLREAGLFLATALPIPIVLRGVGFPMGHSFAKAQR
jgi:hypothetical protein